MNKFAIALVLSTAAVATWPGALPGQERVRLPTSSGSATVTPSPVAPSPAAGGAALVPVPRGLGTTYTAQNTSPGGTLGAPAFDPYSTAPNAASTRPSLLGAPPTAGATPGGATLGGTTLGGTTLGGTTLGGTTLGGAAAPGATLTPAPGQTLGAPTWPGTTTAPYATTTVPPAYTYPNTAFPNTAFPQQPGVLFPNGLNLHTYVPAAQPGPYMRLFQDVRMRYTWLEGGRSATDFDVNELELATTVNFPNFFFSGKPLQVSPGFAFHWWDGPVTDAGLFPTEMPSRAYSAYGDFHWEPQITPQLAADLTVTVGTYSDFDGFTTDAIRVLGTGLLVLGVTPTVAIKGGVVYLDRVDLKMLPAAGILWTPNPQTRFDLFFPRPKLSQYLNTIGNTDIWWYLFGEYGGGSWTVARPGIAGFDRRVDYNDIRVGAGLEWTHQSGVHSFVEVAYAFDRELAFAALTPDRSLQDTVMLRGGISY